MLRTLLPALVLLGLPACGGGSDTADVCASGPQFGVSVTLTDATTRNPITGATVTITEASYSEKLVASSPGVYQGAREREGNYVLTVFAPTYETKRVTDVQVVKGSCSVVPQVFQFSLNKNTGPALLKPGLLVIEEPNGELRVEQFEVEVPR